METNELAVDAETANPTRPMDEPTSAEPITSSGASGVKCFDKPHLLWIRQMGESRTGRGPNPIGPLFLVEMESFRPALQIEGSPNDGERAVVAGFPACDESGTERQLSDLQSCTTQLSAFHLRITCIWTSDRSWRLVGILDGLWSPHHITA